MRTKTMILSGVIAALSGASLMAQVYSLNSVGYINVTVPPNFSMLACQLYATNQSTPQYISPLLDAQLLDGNHNGVTIFKFSAATQNFPVILIASQAPGQPAVWSNPALAQATTLNPGEAVFIYNPYSTNMTLTFVGQVPQGALTNSLIQGFNMVSSVVPQAGALDSALGLTPTAGDTIFFYDPVNGYNFIDVATLNSGIAGWSLGAAPSPAVGQGFFYYTPNATELWTRNFTVN